MQAPRGFVVSLMTKRLTRGISQKLDAAIGGLQQQIEAEKQRARKDFETFSKDQVCNEFLMVIYLFIFLISFEDFRVKALGEALRERNQCVGEEARSGAAHVGEDAGAELERLFAEVNAAALTARACISFARLSREFLHRSCCLCIAGVFVVECGAEKQNAR